MGEIADPVLFAFDFDKSLIEQNSDYVVVEELDADLLEHLMTNRGKDGIPEQFTDLIDHALTELHKRGHKARDVRRVLRDIELHADMREALDLGVKHGSDFCILSDANTVYIDEILKANGVREIFGDEIYTNPAHYEGGDEEGVLRVRRLVGPDNPHGCTNKCAVNMCKGQLLQDIMDKKRYRAVVYVGDSANDFCPSLVLRSGDVVLARSGLTLERLLKENTDRVKARVVPWSTYEDILNTFRGVLSQ